MSQPRFFVKNLWDECSKTFVIFREEPLYAGGVVYCYIVVAGDVGVYSAGRGKEPRFVCVDKSVPQRDYFCFYDYEYVLDVSKQSCLMPQTVPLEQGLKEEFVWYRAHRDSVYDRKPYLDFIDSRMK